MKQRSYNSIASSSFLVVLLLLFFSSTWAFQSSLVQKQRQQQQQQQRQKTTRPLPVSTPLFLTTTTTTTTTTTRKGDTEQHTPTARKIVIVGGGIGGLSSAFDARHLLRPNVDQVVVVSDREHFSFTPSNPWIAVKKRKPADIQLSLSEILPRHGIEFVRGRAARLQPQSNQLRLEGGTVVDYDYLIIATGPRLGFEEIPGLREAGHSVCTTPHASEAAQALDDLVASGGGPVVVGATQGASCFGPAYEYALLLKDALRKEQRGGGRRMLEQCPVTFVTSEPWVGHLGLGGAGDSGCILADLFQKHNIEAIELARVKEVTANGVVVEQMSPSDGSVLREVQLPSKLTMLIPPFLGHRVWREVPGLTDDKGLILVNDGQQSPAYPNIFAVGVCVHLPPLEPDAVVPMGTPKTGYMIESMGTAAVKNIRSCIDWLEKNPGSKAVPPGSVLQSQALLNGLCITDFGGDGAVFVTMPQVPPRRHDWTIHGKVATLAKIAFEKYFLHKIETGDTDPYYEKYMLKLIGVERTKETKK